MGNKSRRKRRGAISRHSSGRSGNRRHRTIGPVHLVVLGAFLGAAFAVIFTGVLGPDPFQAPRHVLLERIRTSLESDEETIVREYMSELRTSNIWRRPPVIFGDSEDYFRQYFTALDPRV